MVRKDTVLVALTCLLVVAAIAVCANASAAPRLLATEQVYYPQGCRCCLFVGTVPNIRCARTCCSSPNERIVASQHNRPMRSGCGSIYVLAYIAY